MNELIFSTSPLFSAIFIIPSHRHIIPVSPREILNASEAPVATELATALRLLENKPTTTEPTTRINQIELIITPAIMLEQNLILQSSSLA